MPSRRLLAVLAAALGTLAVVALWSRRPAAVDEAQRTTTERRGRAGAEREDTRALAASPLAADAAREAAPAAESVPAPVPPLAAPEGGVLVRVVGSDGAPRTEVPVALFAELDDGPRRSLVQALSRAPDGLAALGGYDVRKKQLPSDVRFSVAIALPLEPRVECALDGWAPGAPWNGGTLELVLPAGAEVWLAPLRVEVVDAEGRPAPDVEVELVARPRMLPDAQSLARARTRAPDGTVELPRAQWIEWIERAHLAQLAFDVEARCNGPFLEPPATRVEAATTDPVRIVLPPTGAVAVRLVDHEGRAPLASATVWLGWYEAGENERLGHLQVSTADGSARFEHVDLGLDLALTGALADGGAKSPTLRRAGPTRAGERVDVELAFGAPLPRLVGRFVDARGAPAASMLFWLAGRPLAADVEGRFSVPWSQPPSPLHFEERSDPKLGSPPDWIPRFADVPFPRATGDGRFDAGDVVLRDMPVVVAGRVVDEAGVPVRQAWLAIGVSDDGADPSSWVNLKVPGVPRVGTRADGTFEARALVTGHAVRVSASFKDLESETVVVAPGTRALQLVVARGEDRARTRGSVAGRVRIEEDVPWFWLELVLEDAGGDERSTMPAGGHFLVPDLLPGTYRLEAQTEGTRWPLTAVDGIVVTAGATTSDPRLDPLDLTGRTRTWRARVFDAGGKPLAGERVRLAALGEDDSTRLADDGLLAFLAPLEVESVRLTLDGHAPVELAWSSDEQRVQLAD